MIDLFIPVWLTFIFCVVNFGLSLLNFFKGE